MAAAVAPLPQLHEPQDASALARKRRREIMLSQRATVVPDTTPSLEETPPKRRKTGDTKQPAHVETTLQTAVAACSGAKKKGAKKPQMKYDPDVPMTKEEAAAWRREQRRKRNRESAAASRQRQRDRIAELEMELEEWKEKFCRITRKIEKMEEITRMKVTDELIDSLPVTTGIVPRSPPHVSPCETPVTSPVVSRSLIDTGKVPAGTKPGASRLSKQAEKTHTNIKTISRQA